MQVLLCSQFSSSSILISTNEYNNICSGSLTSSNVTCASMPWAFSKLTSHPTSSGEHLWEHLMAVETRTGWTAQGISAGSTGHKPITEAYAYWSASQGLPIKLTYHYKRFGSSSTWESLIHANLTFFFETGEQLLCSVSTTGLGMSAIAGRQQGTGGSTTKNHRTQVTTRSVVDGKIQFYSQRAYHAHPRSSS